MADFSEITINTTAKKIERMANMEINNETIDDTSDDNSLPTSKLVYDFVSNSASGVNGDFVSYSQSQDLTDEQKETARNNIDATGIYVGSGDMPEGYDIQIDPNGDTYVTVNKITEETSNEIPNCLAVKNHIASVLAGLDCNNGTDCYTPVRGKDYWTDDDIAEIKAYVDAAILGGVW